MLPDKMEHCIVFMNSWALSGAFWRFSKCNITIPHLPADPSIATADAHGVMANSRQVPSRQQRSTSRENALCKDFETIMT
jgi:hypothetical protein